MANTVEYGLKFNTQDMERLIKLAEKLDKQEKLIVKDYQTGEKKKTDTFESELKKRERYLKQDKAWQKQLRNIDIANERKYQAEITRIQREEQRKRDSIAKQAQGKGSMFTPAKTIARVGGYIATATVTYGALNAFKSGVAAAVAFEKEMSNVRSALGNVSKADMELLASMAKSQHIVSQYGISAQEAAQGLDVLAKAGLSAKESLVTLEPALQMSIAGDMDLGVATEKLIKVINGFGLTMNSAAKISDYFAYSAAKSPTSITGISDAMRIAAPAAKIFGQSVESAFAVVSSMSFAQLEGAAAGNAYSRMMLRLTKNQKEVATGLKAYGIDIYDKTTGKLRDMADIFKDIRDSKLMENFGDAQKILGIYAFKSAAQFTAVVDKVNEFKKGISEASGAAKDMAEIKMDNAAGEWKKLVAQFESLWTANEGIAKALKNSLSIMNEMLLLGNQIAKSEWASYLKYLPSIYVPLSLMQTARDTRKKNALENRRQGFLDDNPNLLNFNSEGAKDRKRASQLVLNFPEEQLKAKIAGYERYIQAREILMSRIIGNTDNFSQARQKDLKQSIDNAKYYLKIAQAVRDSRLKQQGTNGIKLDQTSKIPGTTGAGRGSKETYDSLALWEEKMLKLSNDYRQKEFKNVDEGSLELNSKYEELYLELENNKWKHGEKEKALNALEMANTVGNAKLISDMLILARNNDLKLAEQWNESRAQAMSDAHEQQLKETEDYLEKQKELRQKYQGIDGALNDLKQQMMDEIVLAEGKEELILNIKKDYAEQAMQLYREDWEKKNKVANAALGSMEAGYGAFTQAMSDDLQISKNESEAIWEAMKQSFIQKIMDMAWAAALSGIFSFFMNPVQSFLGGFKGGIGTAAGGGVMGGTPGFGAGSIFNAPMSGGGFGGTSLPSMAMVQGTGGGANNNALINELRALRMATASGMAQTVKAINENTPVIQGKFLDAVDVYKASKVGERKSNFIVSPK